MKESKDTYCNLCERTVSSENFVTAINTVEEHCSDCRSSVNYFRNRKRHKNLLRTYKISLNGYKEILRQQNGVCAICKNPPSEDYSFVVDHDHKTGKVRGLLCGSCNSGIGFLKDDDDIVFNAMIYLRARR